MRQLKKDEMLKISGGFNWSASFLNAASRAVSTLVDLGRSLGTAIRRSVSGKVCPV